MKKRPVTAASSKKRLCPLSDPSLGIVSENDHKVGLCLCRYCDCGEHTCPVLHKNEIYLKSSFQSSYMQNYTKSHFDSPLKPQPKLFRPNTQKMDFCTTNQMDYKPIRISPKKPEPKKIEQSKPQFSGFSQYSNDYPDWGESKIAHEKQWYAPLRSTEISFRGVSTYNDSFCGKNSKSSEILNPGKNLTPSKSSFSFGPKDKLDGQTTYEKNMKDYSSSNLNHKVIVSPHYVQKMKTPEVHFKTINNSDFCNKDKFSPDPRLFKMALFNRSVSATRAVRKRVEAK